MISNVVAREDALYEEYKKGDMPRLEYLARNYRIHVDEAQKRIEKLKAFDGEEVKSKIAELQRYIKREEESAKRTLEELEQKKKNGEKIDYFIYFI